MLHIIFSNIFNHWLSHLLIVTIVGTSNISWQDFSSSCCCNTISDFCSCLWRGIYLPKFNICFLDSLIDLVVFWHQVIPQAICTRYGLAVGANFVWLVRILMVLCYPIAYPIGKVNQQITLFNSIFLVCCNFICSCHGIYFEIRG